MASGHRDDNAVRQDQALHPNRRVHPERFSGLAGAMDARSREYDAVRSGAMSDADALRVDINPDKVRRR